MQIKISGVAPHVDGVYDVADLTNWERHEIKRISGLRPAEYAEAIVLSDSDFAVALAVIGARRAGKLLPEDVLFHSAVTPEIIFPETEVGADVPPTRPKRSRARKTATSGSASASSSVRQATDPSRSGEQT